MVFAPHAQDAQPSPSHRPKSNYGRVVIAKTTFQRQKRDDLFCSIGRMLLIQSFNR